jgi:RIO-like serine/threonine protein kinase
MNKKALNNLIQKRSIKTIQIQFHILNLIILMQSSTINDNKIYHVELNQLKIFLEDNGTINFIDFTYVSTLRPNYTKE